MKYGSENLGKAGLFIVLIIGVLSLNNHVDGTAITGEVVNQVEDCATDIACVYYQTVLTKGDCMLWECQFRHTYVTVTDPNDCITLEDYTLNCVQYESYFEDVCIKAEQIEVCE